MSRVRVRVRVSVSVSVYTFVAHMVLPEFLSSSHTNAFLTLTLTLTLTPTLILQVLSEDKLGMKITKQKWPSPKMR
jgi:hypothetical protein